MLYRLSRPVLGLRSAITQKRTLSNLVEAWKVKLPAEVVEHDTLVESPVNLLAHTLNEPIPRTIVPATWHHVYFPPRTPENALAADGYETEFCPPPPFVQRLWAGAHLTWSKANPLKIGDSCSMNTTLERVDYYPHNDSLFVYLNKDIMNAQGWSMREQRCLVYLTEQPTAANRSIQLRKKPEFSKVVVPTPIMLFRYSALTFNSHRIHYDHVYATTQENHPACLVHGPLSSTLLMNLLRSHLSDQDTLDEAAIVSFRYRCLTPLYVNQKITLCGREAVSEQPDKKSYELWIIDHQGNLAVKGTVDVAL
ncbi:hypothetical protein DFQ28_008128 [Apophysomyces sp. BC1034]|nr:hypothetical protein DFQ30_006917 [Apophysomyces sp. BC1015]KAG0181536.1 hypothetical protein DFQ29_008092 [Apophysomyces sp. BC1021]KAG0192738.1 hypothetical protein DFQ28_008128 [Apophysomyces sp. BC1034]